MSIIIEILVILIFGIILFFLVRGLINDIKDRRAIKLNDKQEQQEEEKK